MESIIDSIACSLLAPFLLCDLPDPYFQTALVFVNLLPSQPAFMIASPLNISDLFSDLF